MLLQWLGENSPLGSWHSFAGQVTFLCLDQTQHAGANCQLCGFSSLTVLCMVLSALLNDAPGIIWFLLISSFRFPPLSEKSFPGELILVTAFTVLSYYKPFFLRYSLSLTSADSAVVFLCIGFCGSFMLGTSSRSCALSHEAWEKTMHMQQLGVSVTCKVVEYWQLLESFKAQCECPCCDRSDHEYIVKEHQPVG